jgi:hypothetical protein
MKTLLDILTDHDHALGAYAAANVLCANDERHRHQQHRLGKLIAIAEACQQRRRQFRAWLYMLLSLAFGIALVLLLARAVFSLAPP